MEIKAFHNAKVPRSGLEPLTSTTKYTGWRSPTELSRMTTGALGAAKSGRRCKPMSYINSMFVYDGTSKHKVYLLLLRGVPPDTMFLYMTLEGLVSNLFHVSNYLYKIQKTDLFLIILYTLIRAVVLPYHSTF